MQREEQLRRIGTSNLVLFGGVVQAGGPRRDLVLRAKAQLEKVHARVLGPVLNQVNLSDMGYYYYYYGYYHDGHGGQKRSGWRRLLRPRRRRPRESERPKD